ncbi:MAG: hypothetical protein AAF514_01765 [Verrucomicrobiota bacterium]
MADLFFNIPPNADAWTQLFIRLVSGIRQHPGTSRLLLREIVDREAFTRSIERIARLEFDRILVGHGDPITEDVKRPFEALL